MSIYRIYFNTKIQSTVVTVAELEDVYNRVINFAVAEGIKGAVTVYNNQDPFDGDFTDNGELLFYKIV